MVNLSPNKGLTCSAQLSVKKRELQIEIVNDNPFFERRAADRQGCQINYMIQTKFGNCYLIEIKFNAQVKKKVIDEMHM